MTWHRARSAEQIEDRTNAILQAAAELFAEHRYDQITLVMIGKRINFTRSNVYRYFPSKEAIYLELLLRDLKAFRSALGHLPAPISIEAFCQQWLTSALNQPRIAKLFSLLYQIIEHNVAEEALLEFKLQLAAEHQALVALLKGWLPDAKDPDGFLFAQLPLISGMYPMLKMSGMQQRTLQQAGLPAAESDYRALLSQSLLGLAKQFLQVEAAS